MDDKSSLNSHFDLTSQAGLMSVLASVRQSELSSGEKNELRDLIFLYTNGGGDESVRISLEQKLAAYDLQPVVKEAKKPKTQPAPVLPFGSSRPAPAFSVPTLNRTQPTQSTEPAKPTQPADSPETSKPTQSDASNPPKPNETPQSVDSKVADGGQPIQPKTNQTPESQSVNPPAKADLKQNPISQSQPQPQSQSQPKPSATPIPNQPKTTPQANSPVQSNANTQSSTTQTTAETKPTPTPTKPPVDNSKQSAPATPAQPVAQSQPPADKNIPNKTEAKVDDPNLWRIRQIKAAVNSRVGNPVNLIDINNEVGREYMNALLAAMKQLNAGSNAKLKIAMDRLETAYTAVEEAVAGLNVDNNQENSPTTNPKQNQQSTPQPQSDINETPARIAGEGTSSPQKNETPKAVGNTDDTKQYAKPPLSGFDTTKTEQTATGQPYVPSDQINKSATPSSSNEEMTPLERRRRDLKDRTTVSSEQKSPQEPSSTTSDIPKNPAGAKEIPTPSHEETVSTPATPSAPATPAAKEPSPESQHQAVSLAQEKRNLTPEDLPETINTGQASDPLYTGEIDAGLEQLLSDWPLFKKSGLFGTGPKGREHPLFKKIAGLQIPVLLAGRFEGSNQEIRQSITDYMNGWRYEQGIIYEQGETFERYLRRVIKHILDLQKRKKPADI